MKFISESMTQKVSRQFLTMQKNSPRSLFVLGLVGSVVSTVLACRATLKLEETLDEFKENLDGISDRRGTQLDGVELFRRQDLARAYVNGTYSLIKLYAPALIVGGASIGALTGSHVTLTRRNAGLTAAYSAMSSSFDAYRERVRKELGEERELDLHHAVTIEKVKREDGKMEEVRKADPNTWSPYAKFFDEYNCHWEKDPELNRLFVQCQQNFANHRLHARGHIFLNEVYDMLGFDDTKAGCVVGWVVGNGDNYIDFGIFEARNSLFVNNWERSIILDFNVDGNIMDLI
jgi:Family of unknown function (DUF6353)